MDPVHAFHTSLEQEAPPPELTDALRALWYDAKGNWEAAHAIAQADDSPTGSWIHAYLHRKEGDLANASYWYRKAGKPVAAHSLEQEWAALVIAFSKPAPE